MGKKERNRGIIFTCLGGAVLGEYELTEYGETGVGGGLDPMATILKCCLL